MLSEKIKQLYPSLTQEDFITVITLQNNSDGKGDYIKSWQHPDYPQPTQEQLDAVTGV
jgi:hypothetical protein